MTRQNQTRRTPRYRIARWLADRTGHHTRVDELTDHLDQLEANGQHLAILDIVSIAALAVRDTVVAVASACARPYVANLLLGVAAWWIATWTGFIGSTETFIEEVFALESFAFTGRDIFFLYAVAAIPLTLLVVLLLRGLRSITERHRSR